MPGVEKINPETFKKGLKDRTERKNLLILIVEDQKFSRLLLKSHLAKFYDVIEAASGDEALKIYVEKVPDIIFLDIELPFVNGHKVGELISKLDQDAHIVMVTANNYRQDVLKAKEYKVKGFITKPYTKESIYKAVEEFLTNRALKEKMK